MRVGLVALSAMVYAGLASTALADCSGPNCSNHAIGYRLTPADARPDLTIVKQGPIYEGPGIFVYARPIVVESGYALARRYPYVRFHTLGRSHQYYEAWRHHARGHSFKLL